MSLIIPTAVSTYADASSTRTGGPLRTYVLAQFRSDANLEWVRELRGILVKDELKCQDFAAARDKLKKDQALWARIEAGVGQASIIAIDPKPIDSSVREFFAAQNRVGDDAPSEKEFFDNCATALISGTPLAFFPERITMSVPWAFRQELGSRYDFSPVSIQQKLGGGLRNAKIFAARAHALCDLRSSDASTTREAISDLSVVAILGPRFIASRFAPVNCKDVERQNHVRRFTATAFANSLGRAPAVRSDLTSRSTLTVGSPASSFATRD